MVRRPEAERVDMEAWGGEPTGYGLGRHGWVSVTIEDDGIA